MIENNIQLMPNMGSPFFSKFATLFPKCQKLYHHFERHNTIILNAMKIFLFFQKTNAWKKVLAKTMVDWLYRKISTFRIDLAFWPTQAEFFREISRSRWHEKDTGFERFSDRGSQENYLKTIFSREGEGTRPFEFFFDWRYKVKISRFGPSIFVPMSCMT